MRTIKKATAQTFYLPGVLSRFTGNLQANPTIVAADCRYSLDGGAFTAFDTTPTVAPAGGTQIAVTVTVAGVTGTWLNVRLQRTAGDEWDDYSEIIYLSTNLIDDLSTAANLAIVDGVVDDILVQVGIDGAGLTALGDARLVNLDATVSSRATAASITTVLANIAALPAAVWAYTTRTLTQAAQSVSDAVPSSDTVSIVRGDTVSITISDIPPDVSDNDELWFTYKRFKKDDDDSALVMIKKTIGLVRINGAEAGTPANGSITAPSTTSVVIALEAVESAKLEAIAGYYDVQKLSGTTVTTVSSGKCNIIADITNATA